MAITIKSADAIEKMRVANRIVALVHDEMKKRIAPGVSTAWLDEIAEDVIRSEGAVPSFKGYNGFPGSICTSVNEQIIHGIPSKECVLKEGDIISVDVGAIWKGYHGDGARTFPVGNISEDAKRLIRVTRDSFFQGMEYAKEGNYLYQISAAIHKTAKAHGYGVVRDFVGHGIGTEMHEEPPIPNYKPIGRGPRLVAGMTLAIEPMINQGSASVRILDDGWTVVTKDGSLSAHYENTILITSGGYEILTRL